jgi:hypothetical protein
MSEHQENLGSFFKENSKLAQEYFETQMEVYRLKAVKFISKSAGYFIWIITSLFLLFVFIIFLGIVISIWLSNITGSYVEGFGITTLAILVIIIMLALLRKALFVTPIIKTFIHHSEEPVSEKE